MNELAIAVAAGIGATITPCVLPLYPAFLAYITAPRAVPATGPSGVTAGRPSPAAAAVMVWLGVVLGMVAIGAVIAGLSLGLGAVLRVIVPLADLLLIGLGLLLLLGRNPFARLPQVSPAALGRGGPVAGSFLYGLLFAPIALPCSGPFLIGIFVASLTVGDALRQLIFFAAFGVGFGLPLLVLGLVGELRARELARAMVRWERPLQLLMGATLLVIGAWDLWTNLPQVIG
ncbi:MAG TPA: cytochrome c biogenesis protein CcdA [Candidatus Limnocylindria bacterium]|nr:cytochrome c biogenesis protein CcdA [Candidatus Limnocylindria bacterium]